MNSMGNGHQNKTTLNFNKVQKINISAFYNQDLDYQSQKKEQKRDQPKNIDNFTQILKEKIIQLDQLKDQAWYGIPTDYRSLSWKILLKYQSPNKDAQFATLDRKRNQYYQMSDIYFQQQVISAQMYDEREKKILKLITDDVKRTLPEAKIFRNQIIQQMMERILFIWNIRNPASGYVQGINDIVTPFLTVFLSDYVDIDTCSMTFINEQQINHLDIRLIRQIESDTYWCLNKLLESVLDNYTSHQPGLLRFHKKLKEILYKLDKPLLDHLEEQCNFTSKPSFLIEIDLYGFIFKWNNCLLLRLFSFNVGLRLFDTYMAEEQSE